MIEHPPISPAILTGIIRQLVAIIDHAGILMPRALVDEMQDVGAIDRCERPFINDDPGELPRLRRLLAIAQFNSARESGNMRAIMLDEDAWVADRLAHWASGGDYEDDPVDDYYD